MCTKRKPEVGLNDALKSKYLYIIVHCKRELYAMIDSGAYVSLMRECEYIRMGSPVFVEGKSYFRAVGEHLEEVLGTIVTKFTSENYTCDSRTRVVSNRFIKTVILIGTDFLKTVKVCLFGDDVFIRPFNCNFDLVPEVMGIDVESLLSENDFVFTGETFYRDTVSEMISDYNPQSTRDIGVEMKIVMKSDKPIYQPARRLSIFEREIVDKQISEWLNQGIVRPSVSEYASPIVLVKKKDGTYRLCIDYREINKVMFKDRYFFPLIDDLIDSLQDARCFSTLDLENGFSHVPVEEASRKFISFVVPGGQFEFTRMPFGLCNAPAVF